MDTCSVLPNYYSKQSVGARRFFADLNYAVDGSMPAEMVNSSSYWNHSGVASAVAVVPSKYAACFDDSSLIVVGCNSCSLHSC